MFVALSIATALVVIVALLPTLSHEGWVVRAFDFPRLQIACLLLLLIALQVIFLDLAFAGAWVLLAFSLLALIYESWWIVRYSPLYPVEVSQVSDCDPERRIRIMVANVLMKNRRADALLQLVRDSDPDLLLALEGDDWWQSRLDSLEADYPHTIKCPLGNRYGMHLYSRLPLSDSQVKFLVEDDKPSIHTLLQLRCGHRIRCHFLHPSPPSPTESVDSSERDAELLVVARSLAETSAPAIVSGDLNDVAWSRTTRMFRKLSGLLDPRIGRGMFNTFHAQHWFLRWPLDHLFHSDHFCLLSMRRRGGFGSDHFALVTELAFVGDHSADPGGPDADRQERQWAKTKHRKEGVSKGDVPEPGKGG